MGGGLAVKQLNPLWETHLWVSGFPNSGWYVKSPAPHRGLMPSPPPPTPPPLKAKRGFYDEWEVLPMWPAFGIS